MVLFLSLGGLIAALRRGDEKVAASLSTALYCFDQTGLIAETRRPEDGSTEHRVVLGDFLYGPQRCSPEILKDLSFELYRAFEDERLYFPCEGRLDYGQLDRFVQRHGIRPSGLSSSEFYRDPDAIGGLLVANSPGSLTVYDGFGYAWQATANEFDDPEVDDPPLCLAPA